MSNSFINVHTFDYKLKGIFTPSRKYTVEEKKESFTQLLEDISDPCAKQTVAIIISDMNKAQSQNYQKENNIDASDILMDILQIEVGEDMMLNLNEQLADARSLGICPSGRVTRLLQIWLAFKEQMDEKVEK